MPPKTAIHPPRPKVLPPEQLLPFCDCICTWKADSRNLFIQERAAISLRVVDSITDRLSLKKGSYLLTDYRAATELRCPVSSLVILSPQDSADLVWRAALAFMVDTNQKFGEQAGHHQHPCGYERHYREKNKDVTIKLRWNTLRG